MVRPFLSGAEVTGIHPAPCAAAADTDRALVPAAHVRAPTLGADLQQACIVGRAMFYDRQRSGSGKRRRVRRLTSTPDGVDGSPYPGPP